MKSGMAPKNFCDLVISNGFTMDESGNYGLKSDEEVLSQMNLLSDNSGSIDDKSLEEIETIYSNYMDFISEKKPDELTDFEAEMIRQEREKVKDIRDRKPDELSRYQQMAISRDDARLLGTKKNELDIDDIQRVKSLKPHSSINYGERGYSIKYNITEEVSEMAAREFGLKPEVLFIIEPDEELLKEFWANPESKEYIDRCGSIANITGKVKEITPFIDPYEGFPTQFRLSMPIQREDETYGEFYARIQSYINGIESTMDGKQVEFGERGAIIHDDIEQQGQVQQENEQQQEQVQQENEQQQEQVQQENEQQQGQIQEENVQRQEQVHNENTQQQKPKGLTLQEIGRGTIESFKRNPHEASKMIASIERGIAQREDKGNEKQ